MGVEVNDIIDLRFGRASRWWLVVQFSRFFFRLGKGYPVIHGYVNNYRLDVFFFGGGGT